jgi:hypothetical protein
VTAEDSLVAIRTCHDGVEAQVLRGLLEDHEIRVFIQGENHRAQLGIMGPYIELKLMVPASQAELALEVLRDAESEIGRLSPATDDASEGQLSFAEGEGALSTSFEPTAETLPATDAPSREAPFTDRRRAAVAVLLAVTLTFGTGHMYARAWRRGFTLAALEIAALALLGASPELGASLFLLTIVYDAIGGSLAARAPQNV